MDQDKIDVARATPVPDSGIVAPKPQRRGAPMWLQLILSLLVIIVAAGIAGLLLPSANTMLAGVGVKLPLLTGNADATPQAQAQGQGAGRQGGQAAPQTAQAPAGQRQGQGGGQGGAQGAGRQGGFGGPRAAVVVALPVTSGIVNNQLTSIGEGSAIHSVTVNSASGGTLMTVDVKPGDHVEAGAKLATLDSDTQQNAFDRAKLAASDADAALARAQSLVKTNAIATTAVDAAQLASDNARLAVQAAQIELDQRTITTPIAGTVGLILVSPGNLINAQTVVTTIEDSSQIVINFWVPERYAGQMAVGAAVTAESAALPGKTFTGTLSAVDNKIDPDSRTLQVQATLPNTDGTIKSGMSFTVDMAFMGETFPDVDPLSIQWSNTGAYVWKVVDSKVVKGMVEIIQRNSDGVLVKGDVKPGDQVVTQGVLQLTDNATVRLLDAATGGNGAPTAAATAGQGQGAAAAAPADPSAPGAGQNGQYKKRQGQAPDAAASSQPSTQGG